MQKKLIILDLDGTMVDSVPDLTLCINEMLTTLGYITSIELQVRNWVGNGIERLVQRALTQVMAQEPSALLLNRALTIFRELYSQHNTKFSQLYPGVLHTLDELKAQGYHLACVTNKAQCFVTPLLEAMQLTAYLTFIVAGDTLQAKKPDPSPLLHAINNFGVNLEQTVMVGDSI
ncbi:phosphoglycolate phosphatase, partial [Achromatium sp. WMS2]